MTQHDATQPDGQDIAIVGVAAHLPGARSANDYWRNLRDGVESIRHYSDEEMLKVGVSLEELANPNYVRAGVPLQDLDLFDAEFFGLSPKEAAIMDPQHRHFLECSWEALEDAGHPPDRFDGLIGVFAGCGMNGYFIYNLLTNQDLVDSVGLFLLRHTGNDKDFLATRVSYSMNLQGPSINVQTACSTSLVAIHLASQHLLTGECDMALAGAVTIMLPHGHGYVYHQGETLSPDGHCHAFDHRGRGTVFGSGAGVVVLRRVADALQDGDHIYAVIKGSAVNNDGSTKVGYFAPSVDRQANAAAEALAVAGVSADTIDYVEAHGTGTTMGDPIEIAALTSAFRESTDGRQYCGIGSAKTNIGHLDTASGVAGLIKVAKALEQRQIPPSLSFEAPNPSIDFAGSPFHVHTALTAWEPKDAPRRAGINSLGVGGTNAFMVVEEAPERPSSSETARPRQLLTLSARTTKALDEGCARLAHHLSEHPEQGLADVAYTLYEGRQHFDKRRVLACADRDEAIEVLQALDPRRVFTHTHRSTRAEIVYMFPGGGSQYPRMAADLYEAEPVFREHVDRGLALLEKAHYPFDLRSLLFAAPDGMEQAARELERPSIQLPAIFIVEYATAKLWIEKGIEPVALIGHSLGENTAAAVAGVLSFEDALGLVTLRGKLQERAPAGGGMISVPLSEQELSPLLGDELELGVVNSPGLCVASGPVTALQALVEELAAREIETSWIPIRVAAHSRFLDPFLKDFAAFLRSIELREPRIPFVSNRTGTWITGEQATDPDYWVGHLRHTVQFAAGMQTILERPGRVLIEVGPGKTLCSLVRQQRGVDPDQPAIPSLRHRDEIVHDATFFLTAFGRLWASGVKIDTEQLWGGERRRRLPLPTYAFQRQRYWFEAGKGALEGERIAYLQKLTDSDDWLYEPVWHPRLVDSPESGRNTWLVFLDELGVGHRIVERLRAQGQTVYTVCVGDAFHHVAELDYCLAPELGRPGYESLVHAMLSSGNVPTRIVHLWMLTGDETSRPGSSFFHRNQEHGFYSLFFLAQALGNENIGDPLHITCVSNGMQQVGDETLPYPDKATVLGPCRVIPRELADTTCASVDVVLPIHNSHSIRGRRKFDKPLEEVVDALEAEVLAGPRNATVAHRAGQRLELEYERTSISEGVARERPLIRSDGVYLITGGLGGIGLALSEHLATTAGPKLVLVGHTPLPEPARWDVWLGQHPDSDRTSQRIRRVRELEALGAEVLVASADVADVEEMRQVVEAAKERFGRIDGVVHAAGVIGDGPILAKTQAAVEEVFAPKIQGALVLERLFAGTELEFFVVFSSTSAWLGPAGQVDYAAANAFLNAFAVSRGAREPQCRTVAIDWGIWNEVGMAARLATDLERAPGQASGQQPARHPLFDSWEKSDGGEVTLHATYRTETRWLLDEHRTRVADRALIPGTGYLELLRAARAEPGAEGPIEIQDLVFLRPLFVEEGESKDVRVRLRPDQDELSAEVQSKRFLDQEHTRFGWETHAVARILPGSAPRVERIPLAEIEARCQVRRSEDPSGLHSMQEEHMLFGPRWRVLKRVLHGAGEALAWLELPARFEEEDAAYQLHPALLDLATGFAMELIEGYAGQDLWVPVSYGNVRIHGPLPRKLCSWVRNQGENTIDSPIAVFDVVLSDEVGRVVLEANEYAIKRMSGQDNLSVPSAPSASDLELDADAREGGRQLSPAEILFRHNLSQGILPVEGARAFVEILNASTHPEVVVSSLELDKLHRQTDQQITRREDDAGKFARPQLENELVEPRNEIERTMVEFWEDLLGVDHVGVTDNFFDLGGHSLIAVRLFSMIKKTYEVDYPISILFEAPTIERCARIVQESVGETDPQGTEVVKEERYSHLVVMHPGETSPKTPFFLVAGMFGNVLNLRHLAGLVGRDRPFYGLQARGLYGDHPPHENFREAAHDYIAEMRTVQSEGPYLLGGFSGGGITAYEMAQQLLAQGEDIGLLLFIDTPLPRRVPITRRDKALIHWQRLRSKGLGYISDWARNRVGWQVRRFRKRFGLDGHKSTRPSEFHNAEIEAAFYGALDRYELKPYHSKVILFRPKLDAFHDLGGGRLANRNRELVAHDNGWGAYVGAVEVHELPGDHDSMVLEPNVRVLANRLKRCIEQTEHLGRVRVNESPAVSVGQGSLEAS